MHKIVDLNIFYDSLVMPLTTVTGREASVQSTVYSDNI